MTLRLDDMLSDFHGSSVSGGGTQAQRVRSAVGLGHEHAEEPTTKASGIADRMLPAATFILGALLALLALSVCAAEFYGTVEVQCGKTNVVWRNVPAHVFVQGTSDTVNWCDLIEVRRINLTNGGDFSYPLPTADAVTLYRLRTP